MICRFANPFWGNGGVADIPAGCMAKHWNWLKAQTGNTHPGAMVPFGWVSVLPYSGAYPTGFGVNGCSGEGPAPEIFDRLAAWGFTHFHPSGTGNIGQFYNYMLIAPVASGCNAGHISQLHNAQAEPGYFAGTLQDYGVDFELTAGKFSALHRYKFNSGSGRITADITRAGLLAPLPSEQNKVAFAHSRSTATGRWQGYFTVNNVTIYFALQIKGDIAKEALYCGKMEIDIAGETAESIAAFSLVSEEEALQRMEEAENPGFDTVRRNAGDMWERLLGSVQADFAEAKDREIFYSALYHSMVKPADHGHGYIDFQTMWDHYRTQLPLMMAAAPENARQMLRSMMDTMEKLGFFPNNFMMSGNYRFEELQATALAVYTLCDGFFFGLLTVQDYPRLKKCFAMEFARADVEGKSLTHRLDLAGAFHAAATVARLCGDDEYAAVLEEKSGIWQSAYDQDSGLLKNEGVYYEGTHWNYSFRPHTGMAERINMAGGNEKFTALLEKFFCKDCTDVYPVLRPMTDNRFEGLNNETDMDTPYCWLWAGRADMLSEIIDQVRRFRFTTGTGGCPGNNDSGALSSWYIWSALGIYPLTGTEYTLLGSPLVNSACFRDRLEIAIHRDSPGSIYPEYYIFNGRKFREPWLKTGELFGGGKLEFYLSSAPGGKSPVPDWL